MLDYNGEQNGPLRGVSSSCSEDNKNGNSYHEHILISHNLKEEWSTEPHVTKQGRTQERNILRQILGPSCMPCGLLFLCFLLSCYVCVLISLEWNNIENHVVYHTFWNEQRDSEIKKLSWIANNDRCLQVQNMKIFHNFGVNQMADQYSTVL